ncbi:MAG: hypothetical protein NC238_03020 [Dehalobacter sp.]|nr:hypothetical protein [Dehalobacter sp.]
MDTVFYWNMTYEEISAAIRGRQNQNLNDIKTQALVAYRQADLIAALVGIRFGSKQQAPNLFEAFPGIFSEEEVKPKQQNWQVMKARIETYAAERRKRGERKHDT